MLTAYDVGDGDGAILCRNGRPISLPLETFASADEVREFLRWTVDERIPDDTLSIAGLVKRWRRGEE